MLSPAVHLPFTFVHAAEPDTLGDGRENVITLAAVPGVSGLAFAPGGGRVRGAGAHDRPAALAGPACTGDRAERASGHPGLGRDGGVERRGRDWGHDGSGGSGRGARAPELRAGTGDMGGRLCRTRGRRALRGSPGGQWTRTRRGVRAKGRAGGGKPRRGGTTGFAAGGNGHRGVLASAAPRPGNVPGGSDRRGAVGVHAFAVGLRRPAEGAASGPP